MPDDDGGEAAAATDWKDESVMLEIRIAEICAIRGDATKDQANGATVDRLTPQI